MSSTEITKAVFPRKHTGMGSNNEILLVNRVLPPEALEKIFIHLSEEDLLVCKKWNSVGEAPSLWSRLTIQKLSQLPQKGLQACPVDAIGDPWLRILHPMDPGYGKIVHFN